MDSGDSDEDQDDSMLDLVGVQQETECAAPKQRSGAGGVDRGVKEREEQREKSEREGSEK